MQNNDEHSELIRHLRGIRYIAINADHGGFGLSKKAKYLYLDLAGIAYTEGPQQDRHTENLYGPSIIVNNQVWSDRDIARDDPILVSVIRQLGRAADGNYAKLKIVEVPANVKWRIAEYDGMEWVEEVHRTWN